MYKKDPKEPIFCSGQLEPTWRGPVAGGVLIYTHVGGCGFESRCARVIFLVGFWCFGAQVAARAKRRVVRGRTGGSYEFGGGWPRVAYFPIFFDACFAVYNARRLLGSKHGFRPRCGSSRGHPPRESLANWLRSSVGRYRHVGHTGGVCGLRPTKQEKLL